MTRDPNRFKQKPGLVVLFGSGEMSPTGRKIHEVVFRHAGIEAPVRIGILETPTGYEVNAIHGWPERMQQFFEKGLKNYKPNVTRIRAWRKDGKYSTNDPNIVDAVLNQDYLYCGAGSPGYTIRHLKDSRAYENILRAHNEGSVLCLGSATAVAMGAFSLPVYEIFKVGEDLHWLKGLNFFERYGLRLAIVPHWNNQEGEDFDTTRCWMGNERFTRLVSLLPNNVCILGIDEQTACVFDFGQSLLAVHGAGKGHIISAGNEKVIGTADSVGLGDFKK